MLPACRCCLCMCVCVCVRACVWECMCAYMCMCVQSCAYLLCNSSIFKSWIAINFPFDSLYNYYYYPFWYSNVVIFPSQLGSRCLRGSKWCLPWACTGPHGIGESSALYHSPPIQYSFLSLHSPLSYPILIIVADFEFLGGTLLSILYLLLSFHILLHWYISFLFL